MTADTPPAVEPLTVGRTVELQHRDGHTSQGTITNVTHNPGVVTVEVRPDDGLSLVYLALVLSPR